MFFGFFFFLFFLAFSLTKAPDGRVGEGLGWAPLPVIPVASRFKMLFSALLRCGSVVEQRVSCHRQVRCVIPLKLPYGG